MSIWHILAKVVRVAAHVPQAATAAGIHVPPLAHVVGTVLLQVADAVDPHADDPPQALVGGIRPSELKS